MLTLDNNFNIIIELYKCIEHIHFQHLLTVKPRFIRRPVNKFAHVNKDIEFSCDIYGIPKPKITWTKNGDLVIPSDYFQIIDGKNLRILGLVNSDGGIYQCFGENQVGNIQASAQLTILQPGDY